MLKRKVIRVGGSSLGITIPADLIKMLKWKEGDSISLDMPGRGLLTVQKVEE